MGRTDEPDVGPLMPIRVAIIGGTNYGALAAITSALESLPPGASLILSSNVGVCVFAASEAMRLEIPATTVYWKHEIHRLLPLADLFLVFFDGTNNYVQRVLRRLAAESRRTRLFLPTGREVANPYRIAASPANPLAPLAVPCSDAAGASHGIDIDNIPASELAGPSDAERPRRHSRALRDTVGAVPRLGRASDGRAPAPLR